MIVKEILERPELINRFDFFNDATDTIAWLRDLNTPKAKEIARQLKAKAEKYFAQRKP
jgi:phage regulator Rha-like protein